MDPEYNLELIDKELEDLNAEGLPVIVEGDKDERALKAVGFSGEVIKVNQGIPLFALCEQIASRHGKVILLLDWDSKGYELSMELHRALRANGVSCDLEHGARLRALAQGIKDIESLDTYIKKLREKVLDIR